MKIPCSNCNQRLEIPEELAGQTTECPACNASLAVPALEASPPVPPQVQVTTERISNADEQYTAPVALPKPTRELAGSPLTSVVLGCVTAVGLGIALFAVSRLYYVYILYNIFIGVGLGMVISYGIGTARYRGVPMLRFLTAVCAFVVYLTFNVVLMIYVLSEVEESVTFIEFVRVRAEEEPFINGIEIGAIGNYIVWTVEFLITWYSAWSQVSGKLRVMDVESVPTEVTEFILHLYESNYEIDDVRRELVARGWTDPADQDKALTAVSSFVSLMQDEEQDEEQDEHKSFKLTK